MQNSTYLANPESKVPQYFDNAIGKTLFTSRHLFDEILMLGEGGKVVSDTKRVEISTNFGSQTAHEVLDILMQENRTFDLLYLTLEQAFYNAYIDKQIYGKNKTIYSAKVCYEDINNPDFLPFVSKLLKGFSIAPEFICFEIIGGNTSLTKTSMVVLRYLSNMGFGICINNINLLDGNYVELLLESGIKISEIKLNGKILETLFKNQERFAKSISDLKEKVLALREKGITVIGKGVNGANFHFMEYLGCNGFQGTLEFNNTGKMLH
ncbi:MAG: hypothetical protein PHE25_04110 [Candidatus Gracilibacteria bacterium]|nr:hypothetical protein [Candidatus Gracilibacteria bacterium]